MVRRLDGMELQQLHKFRQEVRHFERMLPDDLSADNIDLLVQQSKRVRNACTLLIRALAEERDNQATGQEATSA
jgi:hypothetical protein